MAGRIPQSPMASFITNIFKKDKPVKPVNEI